MREFYWSHVLTATQARIWLNFMLWSKAVIEALVSVYRELMIVVIEPGEFTKIAFQNGKINLFKAESVSDLISAETEIQRKQAIKIMSGTSSDKFNF